MLLEAEKKVDVLAKSILTLAAPQGGQYPMTNLEEQKKQLALWDRRTRLLKTWKQNFELMSKFTHKKLHDIKGLGSHGQLRLHDAVNCDNKTHIIVVCSM